MLRSKVQKIIDRMDRCETFQGEHSIEAVAPPKLRVVTIRADHRPMTTDPAQTKANAI